MKSVLIVCVNYNSYRELYYYIDSIEREAALYADGCNVTVVVADNSKVKQEMAFPQIKSIKIVPVQVENKGYMNSAEEAVNASKLAPEAFDYYIISNVDISLNNGFFKELCQIDSPEIGWIVNREFTPSTGKDENPMYLNRLSKRKLHLLKIMYTFPILHGIYERIWRRKKQASREFKSGTQMYAGHGSMMIFTRQMVEKCFPLQFPNFLYGEEIYIAEKIRQANLKVAYYPEVSINNISGVSTGALIQKNKCKYEKDSIEMILRLFY